MQFIFPRFDYAIIYGVFQPFLVLLDLQAHPALVVVGVVLLVQLAQLASQALLVAPELQAEMANPEDLVNLLQHSSFIILTNAVLR